MNSILRNWTAMRIIRLVMGGFIAYQGVLLAQWILIIPGVIYSLLALFNLGCSTGSCAINQNYRSSRNSCSNDVIYEEVKK